MDDVRDELARISDKGEIHPIGVAASRRLRAREGTFRVMPAPEHVVFMRYTGEDGRRDEEDGAVVRLAGEIIAPAALCDIVAMVGHSRWAGELVVLNGGQTMGATALNGAADPAMALQTLVPEAATALASGTVRVDARSKARMQGYEGEACGECGNYTLVRNGTCMKCNTCGGTSGCS